VHAAWAAAHPPPPGARLRAATIDGGAAGAAAIGAVDGAWRIADHAGPADLRLAGCELSELVFGTVPLAAWALPADSVLRHLLPVRFAIPGCYSL
jgi:hypothetical protein